MTRYREAFSWTCSIDDFVKWHVTETPLLNVCAGRSPWGDVTLDLHEPADVQVLLSRYERSRQMVLA